MPQKCHVLYEWSNKFLICRSLIVAKMSGKEVESVEAILQQHLPEGELDDVSRILYGKKLK